MKKIQIIFILTGIIFFVFACNKEQTLDDDFQVAITAQFSNGLMGGLNSNNHYDDIDWKTHLNVLDFKAYLTANYSATGLFELITSRDGKTMENVIGNVKTNGYIKIPIHIRSDHPELITINQIEINGLHKNYRLDVDFHDAKQNFITQRNSFSVNIADGVRISLIGMINEEEHIIVYENPDSTTNVVLGGHDRADFSKNILGAHDYYFRKTGSLLPGSQDVIVVDTITEVDQTVVWDFSASSPALDGKYYAILYLNVWIEIWDYNSFMFIINDYLTVSLNFSVRTLNDATEEQDITTHTS